MSDEYRVFNTEWCSCLAFPPTTFCHHRLGAMIHFGCVKLPGIYDGRQVSTMYRDNGGHRGKAPNKYAVPMAESDKDADISRLKKQIAELQKSKSRSASSSGR